MTQLRPAYRCGARVEHVKATACLIGSSGLRESPVELPRPLLLSSSIASGGTETSSQPTVLIWRSEWDEIPFLRIAIPYPAHAPRSCRRWTTQEPLR